MNPRALTYAKRWAALALAMLTVSGVVGLPVDVAAQTADVVLYSNDATVRQGNWSLTAASGVAGGARMVSSNLGWASVNLPLASPANYFEIPFDAPAGSVYRVWVRLRAAADSKWNDAVWVQFSDALSTSGAPAYRIGTSSALLVNLERCSGCGLSAWGWQNTASWLSQQTQVKFAASGRHTVRVQIREDGVEVDQIVLSPVTFATQPPGPIVNDTTIVPKPAPPTPVSTPYNGTARAIPGTINAADFDNGGEGVAYHDTTRGNTGGVYRQTDVDLQAASGGGYNVGWVVAGEWLTYSVNVATAGNYNVQLRVASWVPAAMQVTFASGNVSRSFATPNTGGWQTWTNVTVPMTLAAGVQRMTVRLTSGEANLRSISVAAVVVAPPPPPPPGTGGSFRMMTWNIKHGQNKAGGYDPVRQAQFIASQNPHVVVLQEVQDWTENLPARYEALLEQYTGVAWSMQWAPVIDKQWTEGNVILTRLPRVSSTYHQMHATGDWTSMYCNRSVAQMTVLVGGVPINVFSTHLDWYNTTHRTAQLLDMMAWTEKFGPRRIVGGDFNSNPKDYWTITMMADYYDTWQDITGSYLNGVTSGNSRFDYLFRAKEAADSITPTWVSTPVTTLSDHNPVIADYTVRP
jgi:endonuclease/exonuclease/phosphatase family metal-dependent hydrolase